MIPKLNNVGVIDYTYKHLSANKVEISAVKLKYLNGREKLFDSLGAFLEWCTNDRVSLIFVYDFNFFGGFLDYWAFANNVPLYDKKTVQRGGNGFSLAQECWSALYTSTGMLNFRITLKCTKSTHKQSLKTTDSYHTTEFRGLAPYYGGMRWTELCNALSLDSEDKCGTLIKLIEYACDMYKQIGGFDFLSPHFLRSTYTVGKAARSLYLTIRYGKDSLRAYQREHPQSEELEDYFRERKLLLGGMCIANPHYAGVLCMRKPPKSIKKYDVNGLYTYVANECGELGPPEMTNVDTWRADKSNNYAYIVVMSGMSGFRKVDKSGVFSDPFANTEDNIIDFNREYAIWGDLLECLEDFYDIEEVRITRVYRCRRYPDQALIEYNNRLLGFKDEGRRTANSALYTVAKIFLNSLIGKFLQATKSITIQSHYDEEEDIVRLGFGEVVNNWDKGHFDFLRGSYIYSMARVKVMRDLIKVFRGKKMYYRHWYTDTDSVVTDIDFPPEMLSSTELGKYKLEAEYSAFGVIGKKVYYGRTIDGADKLTIAGIPKEGLIQAIAAAFPDGLAPQQYFDFLNSGEPIELPTRMRTSGGSAVVSAKHTVKTPLPLEFL